jgi:putative DNA primase/helicase
MEGMGYNRRLIEKQRARFGVYQPQTEQDVLMTCMQQICAALAAPVEAIADVQPTLYAGQVGQPMTQPPAAPSAPAFMSAAARADPSRATSWLWPNVIPVGAMTLLTGQPKIGKSQIAIHAAAVVSSGGTWPDGSHCEPGNVILMEVEDSFADTQARLQAAGADLSRVAIRDNEQGPLDLSGAGMATLKATADAMGDVRLVIVSPGLAFFGKAGATDDATVRARLAPLLMWAAYYRVAVVLITHPAKDAGKSLEAQFAGADAYRRAARSAYVAMVDAGDPEPIVKRKRRALVCAGVNGGADDTRFFFKIEGVQGTSRVVWMEPDAEQLPVEEDDEGNAEAGQFDRALGALCRLLPIGISRPAPEVKRAMAAEGFSKWAIEEAAKALGVRREEGAGRTTIWAR